MDLTSVFTRIRDKLDAHYDRRERLIRISRDITSHAKKMIFSLQRIRGDVTSIPAGIQKEVSQQEDEIQKLLKKAKSDVQGANAYRYHRQISAGVQEYIEALTFRHYILHKSIPLPSQLQDEYFDTLPLSNEDYVLGIADMTGELMRRALNNISARQGRDLAIDICNSLRQLQSGFQRICLSHTKRGFAGDLAAKIEVMKTSVSKVESACYNIHVRGSEKPQGWTVDFREENAKSGTRDGDRSDDEYEGGVKRRRIEY